MGESVDVEESQANVSTKITCAANCVNPMQQQYSTMIKSMGDMQVQLNKQ